MKPAYFRVLQTPFIHFFLAVERSTFATANHFKRERSTRCTSCFVCEGAQRERGVRL